MDRLQLYITMRHGDLRHLTDINGKDSVRQKIVDLTPALKEVEYDPKLKNILYVLRSTSDGVFLAVLRTIPPTAGDHLAGWIFIPAGLMVADTDVSQIVDEVVNIVSCAAITTDHMARLKAIFAREYPLQADAGATVENLGRPYAHRFYGAQTGNYLSDLIGSKRYQCSYLPYAGVILVDKEKYTEVSGPDLTDEPLEPMVRIFPPKGADPSYTPFIFGEPFNKPYLVPLMGTVEVVWKSQSQVDVRQSIMVSRPDMVPDPVAAAAKKPEPKPETKPEPIAQQIPSADADTDTQKAETQKAESQKAETRGYAATNERQKIYNFEIPSKSADISGMIKFTINTRAELHDSPIDGYELTGDIQEGASRSNHLIHVPGNSLQNNAFWALGGFLIGVVLAMVCTCGRGGGDSATAPADASAADTTTTQAATSDTTKRAEAPAVPIDTSIDGAIKYLDSNNKWSKEELEQYPDLQGLFDDMNNIKRQRLAEYWGPKLKESRKFSTLLEHLRNGHKKKPRMNSGLPTFCKPGDQTIGYQGYLNCIDP